MTDADSGEIGTDTLSVSGESSASRVSSASNELSADVANEYPHTLSFNISSNIRSTSRIPILFPRDYEVWALHFEDYVLGIEEHGSTIWHAMTQETFSHIAIRKVIKTQADYNALLVEHTNVPQDEKQKLMSNIKAMRLIRFALPPYNFRLKHDKKLDQTFDRFNYLLSRMLRYNLERTVIKQKVPFMNGLRSEWKAIVSTVNAHEQFKSYSLAKLVGILRSHEDEVLKDVKIVAGMGSLALVAKRKKATEEDLEFDLSDSEISSKDKALLVSNPTSSTRRISLVFGINISRVEIPVLKRPEMMVSRTLKLMKRKRRKRFLVILAMNAIIVMDESAEFGRVKVWSIKLEDDERGYAIDGGQNSKSFFTAKTVSKQVSDCERVIDKLHHDCEIGKGLHNMILPFIELKEDEIDTDCYECESIVSSDEVSDSYKIGLEKIEEHIKSKEHKNMVKQIKHFNDENISEFDESDMSEISVGDEIDFLNEKDTVYLKVQIVPNQVFVKTGLNKKDTSELTSLVNDDNADDCDEFFWSEPIDNADETKGLFEMTSWKTKGKYVSEPLNRGKSKVVSELEISLEEYEANSKKEEKELAKRIAKKTKEFIQQKSNIFEISLGDDKSEVMCDEQEDSEWYIDIGCSCHMTGRREELKEYRSLKDGDRVKFGNNAVEEIKSCGMITNGEFSIQKVAYVEGLQYDLISVYRLVLGTGLKVSFDDKGSEIVKKKSKLYEKVSEADCQSEEIFPSKNPMTIPLSNLYEKFLNLFDEPDKSTSSESKVKDNQGDELNKIVNEVAKNIETSQETPILKASDQQSQPATSDAHSRRRAPIPPQILMLQTRGRIQF
ncbi:uncharacterized protein LOC128133731 [Lactuca sativa]|uniref:uncharacterized protein LOC128133731 n=1 Tax=Lactuca sativa TaxID=4236 RepID=UPI0022B07DDA|nr:uncharacterized protein LOC128133731 [Lactuca sativa]